MGWLTGWTFRKSVTLSRASGAVSYYQMKIMVGESSGSSGYDVHCGGNCLSSFNDLRFTASDGTTLLDYWIESLTGTTPNQTATVWVEFSSIGTSATTFYMYYGNSGASAASNGENTFPFFDDFPGSSIDGSKWDSTGSITVSDSTAILAATSGNAQVRLSSDAQLLKNNLTAMRARLKFSTVNQTTGETSIGTDDAGNIYCHSNINHRDSANNMTYHYANCVAPNVTKSSIVGISADTYAIIDFIRDGLSSWYVDNANNVTISDNYTTNDKKLWIRSDYYTANQTITVDWVLVRNKVPTEPAWGSWGSAETEIEGNGAVIIDQFDLAGDSNFYGASDFPEADVSGHCGGIGASDFPDADISGNCGGIGTVDFPDSDVSAFGGYSGEVVFSEAEISATGYSESAEGALDFPEFAIESEGLFRIGDGVVDFPDAEISATTGPRGIAFLFWWVEESWDIEAVSTTILSNGAIDFPEFYAVAGDESTGDGVIEYPARSECLISGTTGAVAGMECSDFEVEGSGGQINVSDGDLDFPEAEVSANGGHAGEITFPEASISATGKLDILGRGSSVLKVGISGTATVGIVGEGSIQFPTAAVEAETSGVSSLIGNGAIAFPTARILGSALVSLNGDGAVGFPTCVISGEGHDIPDGNGDIDFAEFMLEGYAEDVSDWYVLRHDRFPSDG